jgi:hypothetical protein
MNTHELLRRAELGKLEPSEVSAVADSLARGNTADDPYDLLLIVGKSGARQHRGLVEHWLKQADDSMMVRLALQVLCNYWGETASYLPLVREYACGVPWDDDNDVRLAAFSIAAEHLATHDDPLLLLCLVRSFESVDEPLVVRQAAYLGLTRATGKPWTEIPSVRHFDPGNVDPSILAHARRRLSKPQEPCP